MGYRNSPAYVQRRIDIILRDCRKFARAYMDDITVYSKSLDEHIRHLREVFRTLNKYNISLKPSKAYIGYPSAQLLGQRVDGFRMTRVEDKLKAITALEFPKTLRALERYLGMTGYLRHYVAYYAKIAQPLQIRKANLNKTLRLKARSSNAGVASKRKAVAILVTAPTPLELDAFHHLQSSFSRPSMLIHFVVWRILFIDIDASKDRGFGVMVYQSKDEKNPPTSTSIRPILFLSKLLTPAESRYWPTKLEVACLVWAI